MAECQAVPSEGNTVLCVTEDPQGSPKGGGGLHPIKVSAPLMSSSARKNVLIVYIVHEATPKAPARAVSTVITILRTCFQFTFILVVV